MTRISTDIPEEFAGYTPQQQQDVVQKLRRYVERGLWAQDILHRLGAEELPVPSSPGDATED